ncbi:PGAP1-like alpha/beta domain-containing protein, partial [Gilliamella apicola]|uniref:PGAP1-like alpha/beta domain-containing protein n=2 Tax=Gilliamella TaxID=1193503 RepID=UPI001C40030D
MKLNYKLQGDGQPIVFLHGVFGSLDNLNMLAKDFVQHYQTIQVDLRNHGNSPWSDQISYQA